MIKKLITNNIKKNISNKLNLNSNSNFNKISKKISELDDMEFSNLFGVVSYRILSSSVKKNKSLFKKIKTQ